MKWLHAYRNGKYVQALFAMACYEAIKAKQFGKWALRRRATHAVYYPNKRQADEDYLPYYGTWF